MRYVHIIKSKKSTQLNTINQEYYKSREGNIIEEHNKDFSDEEHEDYQGISWNYNLEKNEWTNFIP